MKKNLKRTLAKVMAVVLTVAMAGTAAPEADAAKKIKLSKSSITVTKGKSKKVTIKNVKKNKVKSLKVKSNKTKVATVKKSGKTAVKVTGKKKGSAKITVTVSVKGQKKATKLTLKVKVTDVSTPTPVEPPVTTAPATNAPATTAPAGPGSQTQTPGGSQTTPPTGTTEPGPTEPAPTEPGSVTEAPTPTPPLATPPAVPENITLSYDYEFPAARQVKFVDAGSGCPAYAIDVTNFKQVVVTIEATEELPVDSGWTAKVTLSTTDEGAGETAYTDGIFRKYFGNDDTNVHYVDGKYTAVFDIDPANLVEGYTAEDISLIDCISLQLATQNYDKVKLTEIKLIVDDEPVVSPEPSESPEPSTSPEPSESPEPSTSPEPTAKPTVETIDISLTADNEGNITKDDTTRRDELTFNTDGSVTFKSPATSCNVGIELFLNPEDPDTGVNLAEFKFLKLVYDTDVSAQAFVKIFKPGATGLWDGTNLTSDGVFDTKSTTGERTVYIALPTAVKNAESVGSILIGINKVGKMTIKSAAFVKNK